MIIAKLKNIKMKENYSETTMHTLEEPLKFKPAWWLKNPHLQTIWPAITRKKIKNLITYRERLELADGDFVDLDWVDKEKQGPIVLVLHGLEGSINSHYAKSILYQCQQQGYRGIFMHFRGCSGEPNRLTRNYHSGETKDLNEVIEYLLRMEPHSKLAAIGYSLGGNVLLKWLGETRNHNPLAAAIAISVPFELHKAANRIQKGFSRFYQWYFLRCLRQRLKEKFAHVPPVIDPNILLSVQTMRDFDDKLTAPLHGFKDVDEYYQISSSRQYLKYIERPTLILHAKDDPFMSEDVIPGLDEISHCVNLEITDKGGHVGFVSGKYPWKPEYWLEKRIIYFLKNYL